MYKTNPALFYLIVCGMAFFIVALNVSLFSWVRNKSLHNQIKSTRNMVRKIQSPWQDEDDDFNELSQIVDKLKSSENKTDRGNQPPEG